MIDDIKEIEKEQQEPLVRWISFYLGEERYAIEVEGVREILRINKILPIPGAASFILGITNIRGSVVTVINGRDRFNLPAKEQDDLSRIIVMEYMDEVIGVVVDSVADVVDIRMSEINANPKMNAQNGNKSVRGVVTRREGLIIILNAEKFISGEDECDFAAGF